MIGECLGVTNNQLVVTCRCVLAPMPRFIGAPSISENARELRGVIRIIRRHCQRKQASDRGSDLTKFCLDLGKMTLRRSIGLHAAAGGVEPRPCVMQTA